MSTSFSHWRKSSHSNPDSECVEVARSPRGTIGVRDTKQGEAGAVLGFSPQEWAAFLQTVRSHGQ